ncbi:hypothetical protein EGQ50_00355 [Coxiella endosymbiont of Amblyomma sculptum]|nr:hypothetical protein EGQ50_00355 [Coxiella endosymbiont of Amblyomma sculptum]
MTFQIIFRESSEILGRDFALHCCSCLELEKNIKFDIKLGLSSFSTCFQHCPFTKRILYSAEIRYFLKMEKMAYG